MFTVPADTPLTSPAVLTVAVAADELLQVPPLTPSVSVRVVPAHKVGDPGKIVAGPALIVISLVT